MLRNRGGVNFNLPCNHEVCMKNVVKGIGAGWRWRGAGHIFVLLWMGVIMAAGAARAAADRGWPGERGNVHGDISPCWAHVACSGPCCTAACHHNNFRRMFYFVFWGSNLVIPRVFVCLKAPTLPPAIWRRHNLRQAVNRKLGRVSPIKGGGWGNSE